MTRNIWTTAVILCVISASGASAGDIWVPEDMPTITQALEKAKPGDTVYVSPGEYREYVQLKTGVALAGSGAGKTRIITPEGGCAVSVSDATGVWIDGFTLACDGMGRVIDASNSSLTVSNCVLEKAHEGIGLNRCFVTSIVNNRFEKVTTGVRSVMSFPYFARNFVRLGDGGESCFFGLRSTAYLEQNVLIGGQWGIHLSGKSTPILRSNVIVKPAEGGIAIADQVTLIARNNIITKTGQGFFVDYATAILSHNNLYEVKSCYWTIDEDTGDEKAFEPSPGVGELAVDPSFVDPARFDFHLTGDSACRKKGVRRPVDARETVADMGCYPRGPAERIGPLEDTDARLAFRPEGEVLKVNGVDEEYLYLASQKCSCSGRFKPGRQSLSQINGRPHDVLHVTCDSCGAKKKLSFDVSRFFMEQFLVGKDD